MSKRRNASGYKTRKNGRGEVEWRRGPRVRATTGQRRVPTTGEHQYVFHNLSHRDTMSMLQAWDLLTNQTAGALNGIRQIVHNRDMATATRDAYIALWRHVDDTEKELAERFGAAALSFGPVTSAKNVAQRVLWATHPYNTRTIALSASSLLEPANPLSDLSTEVLDIVHNGTERSGIPAFRDKLVPACALSMAILIDAAIDDGSLPKVIDNLLTDLASEAVPVIHLVWMSFCHIAAMHAVDLARDDDYQDDVWPLYGGLVIGAPDSGPKLAAYETLQRWLRRYPG